MSYMRIKELISMTQKGTFTLPVEIRRSLGLNEKGDTLVAQFDPATKQVMLSKPHDFEEIQERTARYIKKKRKPLLDVDEFYQTRKGRNV